MFEWLETQGGNLVVSVVYRATLRLMRAYRGKGKLRRATAHDEPEPREKRKRELKRELIEVDVTRVLREIEEKERKPINRLKPAEVKKYIGMLSGLATRCAAKSFVGSSISSSEAEGILVQLRERYR